MKNLLLSFLLSAMAFASIGYAETAPAKEQTLSIIKPDAVAANHIGDIIARFEKAGLHIAGLKMLQLDTARAQQFYSVHKEKPFFNELVAFMTSGPIVAIVLEGPNAMAKNREIMGATDYRKALPGTLRADFGSTITKNAVHGSDSLENAKEEIKFFFAPNEIFSR